MKKAAKKIVYIKIFILLHLCFPGPVPAQDATISLGNAVQKTLESSPGVKIEEIKVEKEKGLVQKASGEFDWYGIAGISSEKTKEPMTIAEQTAVFGILDQTEETEETYSLGITRKFRNGIIITPVISTIDYENNTNVLDPVAGSEVSLEVIIPLMRGLGTEYSGGTELAAKSNLEAAQHLYKYNLERRVFQTVSSFWNSLSARQNLLILKDTVKRSQYIHDVVGQYVKGGELEPAYSRQASGELYARQIDLKSGELALKKSMYSLSVAMGLKPDELVDPPIPEGSFPDVMDPEGLDEGMTQRYIDLALGNRGDNLYARAMIKTAEILFKKAENGLKPKLDLNLKTGYRSLDESTSSSRFYKSISNNVTGLNAFVGVSLELPIRNNLSKGEYLNLKNSMEESRLQAVELESTIAAEVLSSIETLRNSIYQYELARQSVENYKRAVDHENRKLMAGEANVTDLIDMEDRYLEARAIENNALKVYAIALAELRLVTGTLVDSGKDKLRFRINNLFTRP